MRKILKFIQLSFFFFLTFALGKTCFSQLTVEVGKDTTYCVGLHPDTMYLPQNITISGGTEPYTIAWECKEPKGLYEFYTASDFLNDTTILTPYFVNAHNPGKWIALTILVTDSENNYAKDSIRIRFSTFRYLPGYIVIEAEKGDSVLFNQSTVGGGIEPLSFHWEPTIGLTTPDALVTWCKTDSLTQWRNEYYIVATDSCGCVSDPGLVYEIRVLTAGIDDQLHEWAPIGAEWYYSQYVSHNPPQANYVKHVSEKDSLIAGKPVKVIRKTKFTREGTEHLGFEYLHQNGDTVFYWKNGEFRELYNFSLQKGDSMMIYSDMPNYCLCLDNSPYGWVTVDSVFSVTINNQQLKAYTTVTNEGSAWGFGPYPIIENIGSTMYLLPQSVFCDCIMDIPGIGALRCYSDNVSGTRYFGNLPCDTLTTFPVYADIINTSRSFKLYPNPASDYLTIELVPGMQSLSIFSVDGRLIRVENVNENHGPVTIQVGHLQPGTYFIKVLSDKLFKTNSFIKI